MIAPMNRTMTQMFCNSFVNTARRRFGFALIGLVWPLLIHAQPDPSSIAPEFHSTLRSGDVVALRKALDGGAYANAHDTDGNTPLIQAAAYGDAACVRLLIDCGANV